MCGIGAILRLVPRSERTGEEAIAESWLDALDASIAQRGPDGRGRFRDAVVSHTGASVVHVAMVHRRLNVIDPAGGRQPMVVPTARSRPAAMCHAALLSGDDGVYHGLEDGVSQHGAIVFNGCIYNHRALRAKLRPVLRASGRDFVSDHSDTESLLHACEQFGATANLLEQLDGMFGFAYWSSAAGMLMLGRDIAGEKPLYWMQPDPQTLVVCSSAAGVLAVAARMGHELKVDPLGVAMWLKHGYWSLMPVRGLRELEPGTVVQVDVVPGAGGDELHMGTAVANPMVGRGRGFEGGQKPDVHTTLASLRAAVTSRLDADVPIGCFLSGGVDSSVVAALAQEAMRAGGRTLATFSVSIPDGAQDEAPFAEMVARHLGTQHRTLTCEISAGADLERLIGQLGLPFGDSSLLPTHWVSAAARKHVAVALGGDGGDELFSGYNRYTVSRMMAQKRGMLSPLRMLPGWAIGLAGETARRVLTANKNHGYHDILTIFRTPDFVPLMVDPAVVGLLAQQYTGTRWGNPPADARQEDFDNYLPQDLMRKVDTASMAVALEVRAPLLERGLVRMMLGASMADAEAGDGRKGLLRAVARTLVPREAIDRKKQGFAVPIGRWFRQDFGGLGELARQTLGSAQPFEAGVEAVVSAAAARRMLDEHMAGVQDYGQRLYAMVVLSVWSKWLAGLGRA